MFIKIYFKEKPLFLCDNIDAEIEPYVHDDDAVFIDELNTHTIKTILHEMQQVKVHAGVFKHSNLEELKKAFFKKFNLVIAGGGYVENKKKELLMIYRRKKWDLPKGKKDNGEAIDSCAVREVREETGLENVQIIEPIRVTYHSYEEGTHHILKETHWFRMHANGDEGLKPQEEEGIEKIIWADKKTQAECLKNTHANIVDVVEAGRLQHKN